MDKIYHMLASAVLVCLYYGGLLLLVRRCSRQKWHFDSLLLMAAVAALLTGGLKQVWDYVKASQSWCPENSNNSHCRTVDPWDLAADWNGVLLGTLVLIAHYHWTVPRRRPEPCDDTVAMTIDGMNSNEYYEDLWLDDDDENDEECPRETEQEAGCNQNEGDSNNTNAPVTSNWKVSNGNE